MARPAIRVMLVTMFEPEPNRAGELTYFKQRLGLRLWPLAGFPRGSLWRNDEGVAAIVAGVGPVNTAVNILTLGLARKLDWRRTHWLVSGIAGGNPEVCSLGSPIFADWVVDGDLAYDLHPSDHPPKWSTGLLPLGARRPYGPTDLSTGMFGQPAQIFSLNRRLATWAQKVAGKVALFDSAELAAVRRAYAAFACGAQAPGVGRGDVVSAARFWHGAAHHQWAKRWVKYWTRGRGGFATASMEDSGTLGALRQLHRLGRADWQRVVVLRSVSNYTLPPPGQPAQRHLTGEGSDGINYPGLEAALENGGRAGMAVVQGLLKRGSR